MLWTSVVIPITATGHWLRGLATVRRRLRMPRSPQAAPAAAGGSRPGPGAVSPAAVLFDRDGTLIHDVPYNGDPAVVRPIGPAREVLDRLRDEGIPVGIVTNQSGIGRGMVTHEQVDAVHARVQELLGAFDTVHVCPHEPEDGCTCRKPAAGMIRDAAARLGVEPGDCVVIGDIGSDVEAAGAAGARGILVPNARTRPEEVQAAAEVVDDLAAAVDLVLGHRMAVRAVAAHEAGDGT